MLLQSSFERHSSAATWPASTAAQVHQSGRGSLGFAMRIAVYLAANLEYELCALPH